MNAVLETIEKPPSFGVGDTWLGVHLAAGDGNPEEQRLLAAWNPMPFLLILAHVKTALRAESCAAKVSGGGTLADGLILVDTDNLSIVLRVVRSILLEGGVRFTGPGECEIAYWDGREGFWRHDYPAVPPGPFARWLSDESHSARSLHLEVWTEEARKIIRNPPGEIQ